MSIAQRFVAGEGELHSQEKESADLPGDSDALAAFHCDPVNLPWVIFRAAFRAAHIEQLPQRARAVLAALARTVDAAKPFGAIFARRELLTGRAMQSMRTFYRSLDDLEAAGLIERRPQSRYVEAGLFGRSYLHLTAHAAALLGLVEESVAPSSAAVVPASPAPSSASVKQAADAPHGSFSHPSASVADGAIYKDLSPASFQKRQPGQVPLDLQRLRSLGFLDFLIFKLMREARENGKRLSDVVEATWQHLKDARAPINYLSALLRSTVDFTHQLRQRMATRCEEQQRLERAAHAELVARANAGQTFIDAEGRRKYVVDAEGQSMVVYNAEEGIGRQATGWKEQFAAARARGQIRPATHADLEAFGQPRHTPAEAGETVSTTARPPVTAQVRHHIAGLRSILGPNRRPLAVTRARG
ncbi:Replication protein O [Paraburkholderia sp. RL18-103-BIB-C]|jgi:hypothetical protein|uniref:Replication protein O n=1 Tax=unclassified Paraburkholderia TaxID=2615204 RepID=UPI0038BD5055